MSEAKLQYKLLTGAAFIVERGEIDDQGAIYSPGFGGACKRLLRIIQMRL